MVARYKEPKPICIQDAGASNLPAALRATLRDEGIHALAFIPLLAKGKLIGKVMAYYRDPHAFNAEEVELAVTIARQLGFSIERMRAEEASRAADEALRERRTGA
ncbi:MAG: GAF domain-containing protein [Methyloceanibacter sp.]